MSINKRVSEIRKFYKLTQQEFAEICGITRQSVNNIEHDKHTPSSDLVAKILVKYPKLNSRWIVLGEGSMFESKVVDMVNEDAPLYGNNLKDRLIESLERYNKYLEQEVERLKSKKDI
jgi:putative transcriptional regulator